ncbi:MAG: GH3 auxin-responsive promoter family protein [Dehalococcoidia bacterium]|nr:GH3 auxin-responsive promoter family protein [Dehalococcoidia bacterium]
MSKPIELFRQGRREELWQMCCGFIDLSLEQFMAIQKRLLLEQIELLKNCELGRKIMRGAVPETVEEFREQVPLTTYADYRPELPEYIEDVLPAKPIFWQHTSGRSVEYGLRLIPYKWTPVTSRFRDELGTLMFGIGIFASCKKRGDVSGLKYCPKVVYTVGPRPYTSGFLTYIMKEEIAPEFLPPLEEAENMSFEDRVEVGFKQALSRGLDFFFGVPIVLVVVGEKLSQQSQNRDVKPLLYQPKALLRLVKGLAKSKIARRSMLPRDLWSVSGIMCGGTDGVVLREKIKNLWGRYPLDTYTCTEAGIIATQTWDYDGMTFIPNLNFLEFIPEAEYSKWQLDDSYQPKTVLLDEVKAGGNYEVVITNFHGGAIVRYRMGDIIKITSLRNEKLGTGIPQMAFEGRLDDVMDIGGLFRLSEKIIWQAIENTNIPYKDWTARREIIGNRPVLHLYIELKDDYIASERGMATAVFDQLVKYDEGTFYGSLARALDPIPIEVTLLPVGAFDNYIAQRRAEGADLAHLKPRHINPSDAELSLLRVKVKAVPEVEVAAEAEAEAEAEAVTGR